MESQSLYNDIAKRTNGSIYIGVVGPVRTGKSTFIKRFMENLILPNMQNEYERERAIDELPQSASGRTVMTTEPKFVPNDAIEVAFEDNTKASVRLIDCVGYIVDGAIGYLEDNAPRMVNTPWYEEAIPFNMAAEIGTRKVITDHSTIGVMVTSDGSICDIPREDYAAVEGKVIEELKAAGKPFVILLNSAFPYDGATEALRQELEARYGVSTVAANCISLGGDDIRKVIESILFEFPVSEIGIDFPGWVSALEDTHELKQGITSAIIASLSGAVQVKNVRAAVEALNRCEFIQNAYIESANLGDGTVGIQITIDPVKFYEVLSEKCGLSIPDDRALMETISELARTKKEYDKVAYAMNEVRQKGYGIVTPTMDELILEEPQMMRQNGRYGVKLKASAPSIHMIRADIETEVAPIVGSEKQSEELVKYLLKEFENDPQKIWSSNIFGKSLHELVNEGLQNKLFKMPAEAQVKLRETLQKIINEGSGGLICIIL